MAANLKLNSTGGGSISFDPGSTASNLTFTFPAAGGQIATSEGSNTFSALTVTGNTNLATASGSVGIGITNPAAYAAKAMISGSATSSNLLTVQDTGTLYGSDKYLQWFMNSSAQTAGAIFHTEATGIGLMSASALPFYSGGATERMRIDTSGNVGIGTSSPSSNGKFAVVGGVSAFANSGVDGTTGDSIAFQTSAYGTTYQNIIKTSVSAAYTGSIYAFNICNGSGTTTEAMRIQGYNLVLKGGNTTVSGTGITFPATQDASSNANTLDDYEEGTWNPTALGSTTAGTTTYSSRNGTYVKIGRQVTVYAYLNVTNMTGTGTLYLGGLPFTTDSNASSVGTIMCNSLAWPFDGSISLYVRANDTNTAPYVSRNNAGWSGLSIDTAFELYYSVSYYAAA